jgi:hypothetical protein
MNIPDTFPRALETIFLGLKYLNSLMRIRDPGWKKLGSGMEKQKVRSGIRINIPDPQHWWLERPTANDEVATGLGSIPAFSGHSGI